MTWATHLARALTLAAGEARRNGSTLDAARRRIAGQIRGAHTREITRFEASEAALQTRFSFARGA